MREKLFRRIPDFLFRKQECSRHSYTDGTQFEQEMLAEYESELQQLVPILRERGYLFNSFQSELVTMLHALCSPLSRSIAVARIQAARESGSAGQEQPAVVLEGDRVGELLTHTGYRCNRVQAEQILNVLFTDALRPVALNRLGNQRVLRDDVPIQKNGESGMLHVLAPESVSPTRKKEAIELFARVVTEFQETISTARRYEILLVQSPFLRRSLDSQVSMRYQAPVVLIDLRYPDLEYVVAHEAVHAAFAESGFAYSNVFMEGCAVRLANEFLGRVGEPVRYLGAQQLAERVNVREPAFSHTGLLESALFPPPQGQAAEVASITGAYVYGYYFIDTLLQDSVYQKLSAAYTNNAPGFGKYGFLHQLNKQLAALGRHGLETGNLSQLKNRHLLRSALANIGFSDADQLRIFSRAEHALRSEYLFDDTADSA